MKESAIQTGNTFYWLYRVIFLLSQRDFFLLSKSNLYLASRAMASVYDTNTSTACKLCGNHPETVEHLILVVLNLLELCTKYKT